MYNILYKYAPQIIKIAVQFLSCCSILSAYFATISFLNQHIFIISVYFISCKFSLDRPQVQAIQRYITVEPDELALEEGDVVTVIKKHKDGETLSM